MPVSRLTLLGHLELSRIDHPSAFITKLVNVDATAEIRKVHAHAFGHVGLFVHFPAHDRIKDLEGIPLLVFFLKIETYDRCGRIWIKTHNRCWNTRTGKRPVLGLRYSGDNNDRQYK